MSQEPKSKCCGATKFKGIEGWKCSACHNFFIPESSEEKKEETCGFMILTPTPEHNGGMWCAENKPCRYHTLTIMHGTESHTAIEARNCEDCIKCESEFKKAKEDGTIDKLLIPPTDSDWETGMDKIYEWQKKILRDELSAIYGSSDGDSTQIILSEERLYGTMLCVGIDKINALYKSLIQSERERVITNILAKIHTLPTPPGFSGTWEDGYNEAKRDIARLIKDMYLKSNE